MSTRVTERRGAPRPGSLKYAAAELGVSLPTLYKLIHEGKLRTYHVGRAHRVSVEAVAECRTALEMASSTKAA